MLNETILVAIVGKSCTGKDTLSKRLMEYLSPDISHKIVSFTTRPPRESEIEGVDYYFKTRKEFFSTRLLEWTKFRNWYYGTPSFEIQKNKINIGVFNLQGLRQLYKHKKNHYRIIPVYLEEKFSTRRWRMHQRDGFKLENIRRWIVDFKDFYKIKLSMGRNWIILSNINSVRKQTDLCLSRLEERLGEVIFM